MTLGVRELARTFPVLGRRPLVGSPPLGTPFAVPCFHPFVVPRLGPAVILILILLAGCSRGPDLFPLEVGKSRKYVVSSGMAKRVATLQVTGRAPVAGVQGYELRSELGNFHVGWRFGWLWASDLAGTRFSPPLPLLYADYKGVKTWKGKVEAMGKTTDGQAELTQSWGDKASRTDGKQGVLVKITLKTGGKTIETESIYMPGTGLVEQSQRVDGLLTLRMKAL